MGPPILCADTLRRSAPNCLISSKILPSACTASTCRSPPAACASSAASRTGWITPVSLLAAISATSGLAPLPAAALRRACRSPSDATPSRLAPNRSTEGKSPPTSTETCSISEAIATLQAAPACSIARLSATAFASEPPEVKTTLRGSAPTATATRSRAVSRICRAARPSACTDEGLPTTSMAAAMAARACGRSGAVAFQSR